MSKCREAFGVAIAQGAATFLSPTKIAAEQPIRVAMASAIRAHAIGMALRAFCDGDRNVAAPWLSSPVHPSQKFTLA